MTRWSGSARSWAGMFRQMPKICSASSTASSGIPSGLLTELKPVVKDANLVIGDARMTMSDARSLLNDNKRQDPAGDHSSRQCRRLHGFLAKKGETSSCRQFTEPVIDPFRPPGIRGKPEGDFDLFEDSPQGLVRTAKQAALSRGQPPVLPSQQEILQSRQPLPER